MTWSVIFLIIAVVLLGLQAFNISPAKPSLGWLGLSLFALYFLFASGALPPT